MQNIYKSILHNDTKKSAPAQIKVRGEKTQTGEHNSPVKRTAKFLTRKLLKTLNQYNTAATEKAAAKNSRKPFVFLKTLDLRLIFMNGDEGI